MMLKYNTRFSGLNTQPGTIDRDVELVENEDGSMTQRSIDAFQGACYPSTKQIVERVRQIRMTEVGKGLRNIFIMTNGSPEWIEELREALMKDYPWKQISSSLEMLLTWEQKFAAQAVDMMIGQRADVFIGNGVSRINPLSLSLRLSFSPLASSFLNQFSSLTGTVFTLRIASGFAPERQRLWL
jgi:hypothetical protein